MKTANKKFKSIDEYISSFSPDKRKLLREFRKTIREVAPGATEEISYNIPAFKLNGKSLVWFAAFNEHIGFYPVSKTIGVFAKELSGYEGSKGTVRFPLDKPLPLGLIRKIVKYRVKENLTMAKEKSKKK